MDDQKRLSRAVEGFVLSRVRRPRDVRDLRCASSLAHGFSLIELIISLAVILIVSAMALPVVQASVANYQLQSAASSVSSLIQSTRYRAISMGYPFQLVLSQATKTYQLNSDPGITDGVWTSVLPGGTAVPFGGKSVSLGTDATLQFSGGGSVKATSGSSTIVLTGTNRTATITVSLYGNVSVVYAP